MFKYLEKYKINWINYFVESNQIKSCDLYFLFVFRDISEVFKVSAAALNFQADDRIDKLSKPKDFHPDSKPDRTVNISIKFSNLLLINFCQLLIKCRFNIFNNFFI